MNVFLYDKIHTKDYHWKYPIHEVLWPNNDDLGGQKFIEFGENIYLDHWQDLSKDRRNYLDILKIAVEENPGDCHIFHLYAREYILQRMYGEARKLFFKLILMKNIDEPFYREVKLDGYLMLAELARANNDQDEAIYWCKEFIKIDPTFRGPYLTIAAIYNDCGMHEQAKNIIDTMDANCTRHYSWVEKSADWSYTREAILAHVLRDLGEYASALGFINKALAHEPDNINFLKVKVDCLEKLNQGDSK